ncbi:MAG: carboxypeptidase regulatory-like domain-containing protein [bacterium]|nr:carboxypeptidase regulatory-like domain-containing protein [bacterium]
MASSPLFRGIVTFLILVPIASVIWRTAYPHRVPEIHGRVIDGETGEPIAGAEVGRRLCSKPRFDLFEATSTRQIPGSLVSTTTAGDGSFTLPGTRMRRLSGLNWHVFKPGWIPSEECWADPSWPGAIGCNRTRLARAEPWSTAETSLENGILGLDVALYRPDCHTIPDVGTHDPVDNVPTMAYNMEDAWPAYFSRIDLLIGGRVLDSEVLLDEAVLYLEGGGLLSDNMGMIYNFSSLLPEPQLDDSEWLDERVRRLANAVVDHCTENPTGEYCSRRVAHIKRMRERLLKTQSEAQGDPS